MKCRGKITVQKIALSYCQVVKKGSHTARLVFTHIYFSYRFLLIGDWEEYPVVIVGRAEKPLIGCRFRGSLCSPLTILQRIK